MKYSNLKNPDLFNIDLLILGVDQLRFLGEVKKAQIFEPNSSVFDKDGLFSANIFGAIGSEYRSTNFGYIDVTLDMLHPIIFENLLSLKSLYPEIVTGKIYVKYDSKTKEFVESTEEDGGSTGYDFFIKNYDKLNFEDNDSDQRKHKIDLILKYASPEYYINKWLVLPAGLRDYTLDKNGKPTEDEVNDLYRELITISNMLKNTRVSEENKYLLDPIRYKLQLSSVKIYHYIFSLLEGKNKFMLGKVGKRAISYGTRNVITPSLPNTYDLDDPNRVGCNDTIVGLYQFSKAISPITMFHMMTKFIGKVLSPDTNKAYLVDPKTLQHEWVEVKVMKRDEYLTQEGLDGVLSKLGKEFIRTEPVKVDKYYLCLIYDDGENVEVIFDSKNIPAEWDKKYIRPITYMELVYLSIYEVRNKFPGFFTRYPVAGLGGIYPSTVYVKTTFKSRTIKYTMPGEEPISVVEYPLLGTEVITGLSPSAKNIIRLNADFDGDACNFTILFTRESISELNKIMDSVEFYITPDNQITYSSATGPLDYVLAHMSKGEPV